MRVTTATATVTALVTGLLLTLSACVNTRLVERWKDPAYSGPVLHKMLVVGVQRDQGRRRVWEDAMVVALAARAVQAEASYQLFPDQAPAPEQLTAMATRDSFDGVAATHFVTGRQQAYIEAYPGPGWGWGYYGWRRRYWGGWGPYYGPGYIESDYQADYQTDVFTVDAAGGKLIWSGITRSLDPSSTKAITDQISHVLVPELVKDGILMGKH